MVEGHSVCAVDLDFARGDLAGILDLDPLHALPEIVASTLDPARLRGCALSHSAGFSVLGQPKDLGQLVDPSVEEVRQLLTVAASAWDVLILDVGSRMTHALVAAVSSADVVLLVATSDILAFRNVVRLRTLLTRRLSVPTAHIHMALNMVPGRQTTTETDLEDLADQWASVRLRSDPAAATAAVSKGQVLRQAAPRSHLAHDLDRLWRSLVGLPPDSHHWHLPWTGGTE
jgi:Flp pilus assembly CpaE family ATPase